MRTAKQLGINQAEEMARGQERGLQNFAEAEASGNEVWQKAGNQSIGDHSDSFTPLNLLRQLVERLLNDAIS